MTDGSLDSPIRTGVRVAPASPLIHEFYDAPMSGEEIERRSFEIIDSEAPAHHFPADQWEVVRRMIHTSGDFALMDAVRFSPDAIASATAALRSGCPIYVDSNTIRAGTSLARLRAACPGYSPESVVCHIADHDVAAQAAAAGGPRSLHAVRKARSVLHGGIAVFGNAPVALLELNRMIIDEHVRPRLVIAMPVGFVHVVDSKAELMSLDVPFIALAGRRGGSPLAVSVLHALCGIAARQATDRPDAT